jgi:glucose dehydrogenase
MAEFEPSSVEQTQAKGAGCTLIRRGLRGETSREGFFTKQIKVRSKALLATLLGGVSLCAVAPAQSGNSFQVTNLISDRSVAATTTPPAASAADQDKSNAQWTMGGQNLKNWRNQPNTGIDKDNVDHLKQKWVFTTGGDVSATPAVADGVVYFPDFAGNFYAVDATTGKQVWQKKVSAWTGVDGDFAQGNRMNGLYQVSY